MRRCSREIDRDGHIDLAGVEPGEYVRRLGFQYGDVDVQVSLPEFPKCGGQQAGDRAGEGADRHGPVLAGAPLSKVSLGPLQLCGNGVGMVQQDPGLSGQSHATSLPFEQRSIEFTGQGCDLLRHGGRGQEEGLRRADNGASPVKFAEDGETPYVDRKG